MTTYQWMEPTPQADVIFPPHQTDARLILELCS